MAYVGNVASAIDLGGSWGKIAIGIPSMASGGNTVIHGSDAIDGTFVPLYLIPTSSPNIPAQVSIASSVSNGIVPVDVMPCQFVKVGVSTAATATPYTFKLYCSTN